MQNVTAEVEELQSIKEEASDEVTCLLATVEELHQNLQPDMKSEEEEAVETISLGEEQHQEEESETSVGAIEEAVVPGEETIQSTNTQSNSDQTFKEAARRKKKKKRK
ncbi:hypothetical protein MHYP_G00281350 [Metynnis hypsauchen]